MFTNIQFPTFSSYNTISTWITKHIPFLTQYPFGKFRLLFLKFPLFFRPRIRIKSGWNELFNLTLKKIDLLIGFIFSYSPSNLNANFIGHKQAFQCRRFLTPYPVSFHI